MGSLFDSYRDRLRAHLERFFAGHRIVVRTFADGPIVQAVPGFLVFDVEPGPRTDLHVLVSCGAGMDTVRAARLEFFCVAGEAFDRCAELLAMTVWYHLRQHLDVGHTLPVGEPWIAGSTLDHALVSLPYTFGPQLEEFALDATQVRILWLLPITAQERAFKIEHGLEALEQRFEERSLRYWDFRRPSCCP